jgi:ribosomal protein S12 methylthiotransferase accessory factor
MRREKFQRDQIFTPFHSPFFQKTNDARTEMMQPCGRFTLPYSFEERSGNRIAEIFAAFDDIEKLSTLAVPGVPLNWLRLVGYLYAEKIIGEPRFYATDFSNDRPKINSLSLVPTSGNTGTDGRDVKYAGRAGQSNLEDTLSKTVGEMIERYFLTVYRTDSLYAASAQELKARHVRALDIDQLNGYLPWQKKLFPKFDRTAKTQIKWIKGVELESNKPVLIPAQLVFWNYDHARDAAEPYLADHTTSGAAGHFTREEALLSSLLESIERDGFLIYWLNSISPKMLDLSAHPDPEIQEFLAYMKRYRLEVYFLNTTTDIGIPTITCAIIDHASEKPTISLGSASGFNLKDVALHSGHEALMVYSYGTKMDDYSLSPDYQPFADAEVSALERVRAWRGEAMLERFKFFISGAPQDIDTFDKGHRHLTSAAQQLDHVLKQLQKMGPGYEVYLYEVKHRVLDTLGYHVVRAIVPQLIPIYLTESFATLDSKRLREVPEKLGYAPAKELNPWPHPFP